MKTTIDIADDLLLRAKRVAAAERTTLKSLTEEGLRHVLQYRHLRDIPTLEPHVFRGGGDPPDLSWSKLSQLLYDDEGGNFQ